ncbi:MAG: oligosaccharide repeat unit polymerase family protein [Euryarchaeota archaeon]|nr:oligosaccharide repeat unit polymerase family protein [Euryarchaeota archaeon]
MNVQGSKFLSIVALLARFFRSSFEKSDARVRLLRAAEFLMNSFSSSFVRKIANAMPVFYPAKLWKIFDAANAKFRGSLDIFNPALIFPLVYFAFVSISSYTVSLLGLVSILLGMSFFVLGVLISGRIGFGKIYLEEHSERIAIFLVIIASLSLAYDLFYAGSIPLLNPAARRHLSVTFTMLSSLLVPGGILVISLLGKKLEQGQISLREARVYALLAMVVTTGLISLLGYRTQTIVALLGCTAAMYYRRIIGVAEILVAFFSVIFAVSSVGYYRALSEGSSIGFMDVIGKRIGLTLNIYDYLINRFPLGVNRGSVLLATFSSFFSFIPGPRLGPRTIVAQIFGVRDVSMTSTLLGTVVVDFGIPGIIFFTLLLGFAVGLAYSAVKQTGSVLGIAIFSLLIAYTLVGIETGLVDFNVVMFFIISFLVLYVSAR